MGYPNMGLHAEWTPDGGWISTDIGQLNNIPLLAFEVVDMSSGSTVNSYRWCPTCANPDGP